LVTPPLLRLAYAGVPCPDEPTGGEVNYESRLPVPVNG
jgi:hypothetical protein